MKKANSLTVQTQEKYTLLLQLCDIPTKTQLACSVPNLDAKMSYPFTSFNIDFKKSQKAETTLSLQKAFAVAATQRLDRAERTLCSCKSGLQSAKCCSMGADQDLNFTESNKSPCNHVKKTEGLLRTIKQQNRFHHHRENTVITWKKEGHWETPKKKSPTGVKPGENRKYQERVTAFSTIK